MPRHSNSSSDWSRKWIVLLTFLCVAATCVAVIVKGFHLFSDERDEPFIQGADDAHYYLWLRSIVIDGDVDFSNDVQETPFLEQSAKDTIASLPPTETGLTRNKFAVGWAVMSMPAYVIAHWLVPLTDWSRDGFSPPYQIAVWLQQMLIAGIGFWFLWKILRRWFDARTSLLAILSTWLVSPMIYYQTARIAMVHNVIFVSGVVIVWLALKIKDELEKENRSEWLVLTFVLAAAFQSGIMVICRPSTLVYLILPVLIILGAMLANCKKQPGLLFMMIVVALVGGFIGVSPQLLAWKEVFGHWIFYSYEGERFNWGNPQLYMSLFSSHHGLFNWHPLLFVGLSWLLFVSLKGKFYRSWIVTFVLIIWTNSAWHMVYFGSAFGGRAYEFLVFFAVVGMAFLLDYLKDKKRMGNLVLGVFSAYGCWNILFMYSFMQGLVSREEPVSWLERIQAVISIFG